MLRIFLLSSVVVLAGCSGQLGTRQAPLQVSEKLQNARFCEILRNTLSHKLKFSRAELKGLTDINKRDLGALKSEYQTRCEADLSQL